MGNEKLCGLPSLQVQQCKYRTHRKSRKKMLFLVIVLPLSITLIIVVPPALKYKLIKGGKSSTGLSNDGILSSQATLRRFSYQDLFRATNKFSTDKLISVGRKLHDGFEVVIKVFHQNCSMAMKSFNAECEVMTKYSCSNKDFKAFGLEYMPNGSLEDCLHSTNSSLNIFDKLNIMIDVVSDLE
ncbi:hypothetical protein CUMW_236370 [Citrus unshiu]|uniref:Serine-threonine/tyrosine-protein kinase catalytic domain-containing protein n=1 Tax=Citrus unshiu TaxID=55188 RepID=A0A2H5QJK2_CITUN|nr:hypothetical protein CUMW_236370 [Citrus unshiu]